MVIYMKTSIKSHLIITTVNHDRLTCLQDLLCVASVLELRVYREEIFTSILHLYICVFSSEYLSLRVTVIDGATTCFR